MVSGGDAATPETEQGSGSPSRSVNDAVDTFRESMTRAVEALRAATNDPDVAARTREATDSLLAAITVELGRGRQALAAGHQEPVVQSPPAATPTEPPAPAAAEAPAETAAADAGEAAEAAEEPAAEQSADGDVDAKAPAEAEAPAKKAAAKKKTKKKVTKKKVTKKTAAKKKTAKKSDD